MAIPGYENQVSPIFLVALLYGSYPMSVMFSYCLIGNYPSAVFFLHNVISVKVVSCY